MTPQVVRQIEPVKRKLLGRTWEQAQDAWWRSFSHPDLTTSLPFHLRQTTRIRATRGTTPLDEADGGPTKLAASKKVTTLQGEDLAG